MGIMAKATRSLDMLRNKVVLTLFLSLFAVALVLAVSYLFLSYFSFQERAKMSLMTYSRLSNSALEDEDDDGQPPGLSYLEQGDFATIGVSQRRKVTSIEYSGENNFLTTMQAQAIIDAKEHDGIYQNFLYHGDVGQWGGFYMVMDLTVVKRGMARLALRTSLILLVSALLFFVLARRLATILLKPAEEAFKRQQQFTADCSHELKTPLAAIRANADLIEAKQGPSRELDAIQTEAETMGNLIGELLTLAKLDEVDQRASFVRLDLSEMASNIAMLMEALLDEKTQKLERNIEPHVMVKGSKRNLQKLISSLLENAASHAPEQSTVTIMVGSRHGHAVLSVANPSEEIPKEHLAHLFDRFYQANPESSSSSNFGLGLAIAKSIAETHGGAIAAAWDDGLLTFTVTLPLQS